MTIFQTGKIDLSDAERRALLVSKETSDDWQRWIKWMEEGRDAPDPLLAIHLLAQCAHSLRLTHSLPESLAVYLADCLQRIVNAESPAQENTAAFYLNLVGSAKNPGKADTASAKAKQSTEEWRRAFEYARLIDTTSCTKQDAKKRAADKLDCSVRSIERAVKKIREIHATLSRPS